MNPLIIQLRRQPLPILQKPGMSLISRLKMKSLSEVKVKITLLWAKITRC
ncbi:hypothetical protein [Treponema sp. Marseille-Q3903]|nr:hypothetical protein [Treponema sp. Marseille-Q3903]MBC6713692.1 hypothetical protein [Treponema sp. Marseille-Q3903]